MSVHQKERISGLLDGELRGIRRWLTERHVHGCPICAVEYRRQRHVRQLLQANLLPLPMSDSADFFWAKVKAQIRQEDEKSFWTKLGAVVPEVLRERPSLMAWGPAALAIAAFGIFWFGRMQAHGTHRGPSVAANFSAVEKLKTLIPNTSATSLQSNDSQDMVIWVSGLPWTPNMNEMKTEFANLNI